MNRRTFLAASSVTLAALAGCNSNTQDTQQNSSPNFKTTADDHTDRNESEVGITTVESERPISKRVFLEAREVDTAPSNVTVYEYTDSAIQGLEPVRDAVREAVQTEETGNAGIASKKEKEAIQQIQYVRYQEELVKVQVMTLD